MTASVVLNSKETILKNKSHYYGSDEFQDLGLGLGLNYMRIRTSRNSTEVVIESRGRCTVECGEGVVANHRSEEPFYTLLRNQGIKIRVSGRCYEVRNRSDIK